MASIQQRGAVFQLRIKHKLLQKPFFHTCDTREEAENLGQALESMLARGIVPVELLAGERKAVADALIFESVRDYRRHSTALTDSDDELLNVLVADRPVVGLRVSGLTFAWVEGYIRWLKAPEQHYAPGSIRKRIEALGRVIDWHIKSTTRDGQLPIANPLRLLPKGYSTYSASDARATVPRYDAHRDRRLAPEEAERITVALAGVKREDRERPFTEDPAFPLLYDLIVDTGLRLSEAYRLRVDSINLLTNVIAVEGSKGHRGLIKPRVVPIKKLLREPLRQWCEGRVGLLFPYWDGSKAGKKSATNRLSQRFAGLFDYAQVADFTEHDLRHEAACRWFEMRDAAGRWVFSEVEICRIMGWTDTRMALRYASLRGEDLSSRLG